LEHCDAHTSGGEVDRGGEVCFCALKQVEHLRGTLGEDFGLLSQLNTSAGGLGAFEMFENERLSPVTKASRAVSVAVSMISKSTSPSSRRATRLLCPADFATGRRETSVVRANATSRSAAATSAWRSVDAAGSPG
jgi:hypothetical protein